MWTYVEQRLKTVLKNIPFIKNFYISFNRKGDQKLHLLKLNDLAKFILRIESYDKKLSSNTFYVANLISYYLKFNLASIRKIFIYIPHFVIKLILKFFDKIYLKMVSVTIII